MAREEELTLLGAWPSPFSIRVRVALNLKGIAYRNVEEDLLAGSKSELLLISNPVHKKIPVLLHNGRSVCESRVIMEYVDEVFPANHPRILPADPYDRAVTRFWASCVDDNLFSAWAPIYYGETGKTMVEGARQVVVGLETLERAFKECSKGKAFFGGESVGLVDIMLGSLIVWLRGSEAMCGVRFMDAARTPLLVAWAERFCALDSVKEVITRVLQTEASSVRAAISAPVGTALELRCFPYRKQELRRINELVMFAPL